MPVRKVVFICLIVLMTIAAGCSSKNNSPSKNEQSTVDSSKNGDKGKPVELRWMLTAGDNELKAFQSIADAFNNNQNSIKVTLEPVPGAISDYHNKLLATVAGGNPPDFVRLGEDGVRLFKEKNQLLDLKDYVSNDLNLDEYTKMVVSTKGEDGSIYSIPMGGQLDVIFINKDLFEKNGLPLPPLSWKDAWTWEQVLESAAKITTGEGNSKIFGFAGDFMAVPQYRLDMLAHTNGASIFDNTTNQFNVKDPKLVTVLEYVEKMIKDGTTPTNAQAKAVSNLTMFKEGKLGIMQAGTWLTGSLSDLPFSVGFAPLPKGPDAAQSASESYMDSLQIFKSTKHPQEAWAFIKFAISEEAQEILLKAGVGGVMVNKKVLENNKAVLFDVLSVEEKDALIEGYDYAIPFLSYPNFAEVGNQIGIQFDIFGLGKRSAKDLVNDLDIKLKEVVNK